MATPLYFARPNLSRLKLGPEAIGRMLAFRQSRKCDPEAGGVLLGRHLHEGGHVIVDAATPPMRGDRATRHSFHRSHALHQRAIDEAWSRSGGRSVYLGEWHTHPEPDPHPSPVDLDDWRRRLREDDVEAAYLFFIIVGQEYVAVWEGVRPAGPIQRLAAPSPLHPSAPPSPTEPVHNPLENP